MHTENHASPPRPIRAALFDVDGTLVDTNDLHAAAYRRLAAAIVAIGAGYVAGAAGLLGQHRGGAGVIAEIGDLAFEIGGQRAIFPIAGARKGHGGREHKGKHGE